MLYNKIEFKIKPSINKTNQNEEKSDSKIMSKNLDNINYTFIFA